MGNEGDFIRGFTNTGTHSAINFNGSGGTIDTNGFNVRIKAGNVIATTDVSTIDGQAGTVITKDGTGTLAFEPDLIGGTISVRVKGGTFSQQGAATIDNLTIDGGAVYVLDSVGTPPPAQAFADGSAGGGSFEGAGGGNTYSIPEAGGADAGLTAGAGVQGVPEPGVLSLLLVSGLGLLGRRSLKVKR